MESNVIIGKPVSTASNSDLAEIERVFELQKNYHRHGNPIPVEERKRILTRFRETMLKYKDDVKRALYNDMGRPTNEEVSFEVAVTVHDIDEAIAHLDNWTKPVMVEPSGNKRAKAYLHYEPKGVVLLLGAWNFPFSLITTPLVAILSAGNSAIIKTTETTPESSHVLKKIISEAFDEKHVYAFEGNSKVTEALQKLPFDHVFFTGSPRVGKAVMTAAAAHLSSVTLELGGKNPAIVDGGVDLAMAARNIVTSRLMNGGQTCLCIDYVCVPRNRADELTQLIIENIRKHYYVNGAFQQDRTSRIVNKKNFERIVGYLEDARALGATFETGGIYNEDTLTIEPTVLSNVPETALIMEEEIFGPVVVIVPYDTISDAYNYMDKLGKPLGMFIYAADDQFVQEVLDNTSSGIVCVNGWLDGWSDSSLPFGGVGSSGIGAYHGIYGFREVSHQRAVFENPKR